MGICIAGSQVGSIPARAGEPPPDIAQPLAPGVYPRACGGAAVRFARSVAASGLSPRVRGSRAVGSPAYKEQRSIPARAGEPCDSGGRGGDCEVYPRACGGAGLADGGHGRTAGLSPRVRGSQKLILRVRARQRSIPARAGEPPGTSHRANGREVYPRACGGARPALPACPAQPLNRSIPARAGEPTLSNRLSNTIAVYPRACGGAAFGFGGYFPDGGLSPRVRGSRVHLSGVV